MRASSVPLAHVDLHRVSQNSVHFTRPFPALQVDNNDGEIKKARWIANSHKFCKIFRCLQQLKRISAGLDTVMSNDARVSFPPATL
jgi:hypothetical protein